ncbi:MAG: trypsin-like peptidase domain-containing protein [Ignavibacteria bacterium]|nr:MAG: PDZ domain-containing protein [Chlorobiota bacterium]MBV6399509.1 putative serine protease HtrA [Ignavibacteria bacterium]MCC6886647.1 trypsin-like peptidase domain-containing protein [Ignavibacteriales bacterium]MCE7953214.1 PDZ domain-containing protein [Chlorobi bacterium CHB7]RIK50082.1 MAG: 2-alkenal reductase [Ignavibacteriota bacterium]
MENVLNHKSYKKNFVVVLVIVVTLIVSMIAGGFLIGKYFSNEKNVPVLSKEQLNENVSEDRKNAITSVVSKVSDAIVGINVEEVREVRNPFYDDPFFRQFFGDIGPQKQVVRGLGSGFIISPDGYILTNDHVAGNATKISVTLTTGETVQAELIGSDQVSDVALLKIDKKNLPFLEFANSDNVLIGEWAIAFGNPFGLFEINDKPTVTVGVVSATNMSVTAEGRRVYKDMIQTDASINSGNSGGPLVDIEGKVIGMNTIIYTGGSFSSGSIGVGFAISINRVVNIMNELKAKGSIDRNFNVGFNIQPVDERIAQYYELEKAEGVIVTQILRGGLADRAGLKPEDIIIGVNGKPVRNQQDLVYVINDSRVGDVLILKILRDGDEREIEMTLEGQ